MFFGYPAYLVFYFSIILVELPNISTNVNVEIHSQLAIILDFEGLCFVVCKYRTFVLLVLYMFKIICICQLTN